MATLKPVAQACSVVCGFFPPRRIPLCGTCGIGATWPEALRWAAAAGTAKAREARTDRLNLQAVQRLYRRIKMRRR